MSSLNSSAKNLHPQPAVPVSGIPDRLGFQPELDLAVDDEDLEDLESELKQMTNKILHFRTTLPDQLRSAFSALLSAQRPVFPEFDSGSDPGPSGHTIPGSGQVKSSKVALQTEEDQKTAEKVRLLKEKISSNASTMPVVLKRMKECMSRIDKLDSYNGIIHPAFKKKKTS